MSTAPSGWQNPKLNWQPPDPVGVSDLNRIEGNLNAIETGSRTLDPSQAPTGNEGTLRQLLDWFANRIRSITGAATWYDAPATTLAAAKAHMDRQDNPHGVTAEQVSAVRNVGGVPMILADTEASRPTPGASGRIYIATDTRAVYRDSGAAWDLVAAAGSYGGSSQANYITNGRFQGGVRLTDADTISAVPGTWLAYPYTGGYASWAHYMGSDAFAGAYMQATFPSASPAGETAHVTQYVPIGMITSMITSQSASHYLSAYVRVPDSSIQVKLRVRYLEFVQDVGWQVRHTTESVVTPSSYGAWVRVGMPVSEPMSNYGLHGVEVRVTFTATATSSSTRYAYVTAVQLEEGYTPSHYVDGPGSAQGRVWTAYGSAQTMGDGSWRTTAQMTIYMPQPSYIVALAHHDLDVPASRILVDDIQNYVGSTTGGGLHEVRYLPEGNHTVKLQFQDTLGGLGTVYGRISVLAGYEGVVL